MRHERSQPPSGDHPARLTIAQAASVFGLSHKTIRRWIAEGRVTAYRVGKRAIRIDRDSLLGVERRIGA